MKSKFTGRLKELRAESGLTQKQLAENLNVCKSAVSAWEIGRNQPDYDLLIDIADFFKVTVDFLVGKD